MDLVEVAIIGKSVGLQGYVKLHNRSDFPEQFKANTKFFTKDGRELVIKFYDSSRELALFLGYESVEGAKTLTNMMIYTTKEQTRKTCKLKKDEFFYFDIIGLDIVEDGEKLGVVEDIFDATKDNLLYIKTDERLVKLGLAKSFYIPYLDNFIENVDLQNKTILTKNSKTLLESL
ncbi:16S rRNA processing protein RimM [Campylobacter sp. faydin G-24]|uniref:Ribosome maturation factor RimM n=1 Tax=Campylobacter anatolicus TaxID=2829105 RepID=A0ABS5HHN5_9BACT|nr:ribosome maturation factor RimM [Campylobacter anatolicus]MBR8463789.1 16S rRNA processing protein RimM [Campylobacter anatolicus]